MQKMCSVFVLIAAMGFAQPSPAFPSGWQRGGAASPMPAPQRPGRHSFRRLVENASPPRRPVEPHVLRLADLPVVEVLPAPNWEKIPTSPPSNDVAQELTRDAFDWGATGLSIGIRDSGLGFIQIGWRSQPLHPKAPQGVFTVCGAPNRDTGGDLWRKARWQFIKPAAGGAIEYEQAEAWFSYADCQAYVMRRLKTPAHPTAGGLAYAFRTICPACKPDDRELLHVITPGQEFGSDRSRGGTSDSPLFFSPIEHITLPLHLGTAFMAARFETGAILRFKQGGATTTRTSGASLSVQITQGVRDLEPVAMVYVEDAPNL